MIGDKRTTERMRQAQQPEEKNGAERMELEEEEDEEESRALGSDDKQ